MLLVILMATSIGYSQIAVNNTPNTNTCNLNGDTVTVLGNTGNLIKMQDGISFLLPNWNTDTNGSGTDYAASATFSISIGNVILNAQWSALSATGPAGGVIFYDAGSVQSWGRYLEAAANDQSSNIQWYDYYYRLFYTSIINHII